MDNAVRFDFKKLSKVDPECWKAIKKKCTHTNNDFFKQQRLGFSTNGIPQKIKTFELDGKIAIFNRGELSNLRKIFKRHNHTVKLNDQRLVLPKIEFNSNIKPFEYQKPAIDMILKKQQGVVRGPCSAGKTVTLLEAVALAKQPALIIVWSTELQEQWIAEATNSELLNLSLSDIGGIGGVFKKPKVGKLNICMQQSLWTKKNLEIFRDKVGFVGCDEVQRFAARTFQSSVNEFPAKYRIGVSANERRKDGKEFLIYSAFGKLIYSIPKSATAKSRIQSKIFLLPTKFYSEAYEIHSDWTSLIGELTEDEDRNRLIVKRILNSLNKGKLCLVLTERVDHALFLRSKFKNFRTGVLIGNQTAKRIRSSGWPKSWKEYVQQYNAREEFKRVREQAAKRKLDLIIATQKGNQGISIKTIDHGFVTTPTGNNVELFDQQCGRVERFHPGKKVPRVFYFWDVKNDKLRDCGNAILRTFPNALVLKRKRSTTKG